jgi:hypothetical protein
MPWERVKRDDRFQGSDRPFISISMAHIAFNAMFTRIADLGHPKRVRIHADPENFKLGFEFTEEDSDSYSLSQASSDKKGKKRQGVFCASGQLPIKYTWVKSVANLSSIKDKRFEPKKEGNLWVIQLCPAFEERKARESENIPSDVEGIYRYITESGEIVYIGRGDIKKRLMLPERKEWHFDIIEYSIVNDPDQQVKWEEYWLRRHKENNRGKLPFYNKVSGFSSEE